MFEIDASQLAETGRKFLHDADVLPAEVTAQLRVIQSQIEYAAVAEMRTATPGSTGPDSLAASTIPQTTLTDDTLTVNVVQTKTIESRRLGTIPLADLVIGGIKNPVKIEAGKDGTLAFLWKGAPAEAGGPGMYFRHSVQQKARAGDPYPERAIPATISAVNIITQRYGDRVMRSILP